MPRLLRRQVSQSEKEGVYSSSEGTLFGDGVTVNGIDSQEARRAHMRAQTTARQASEQRLGQPQRYLRDAEPAVRLAAAREREVERQADVADIDAQHQVWLNTPETSATEDASRRRSRAFVDDISEHSHKH